MFDSLSDRLHAVLKRLRGESRLSEANIAEAMREIRTALLEADVNLEVASQFVARVSADCIGQEVLSSVTPGQQVVKVVHDHLVELLGSETSELVLDGAPAVIMLCGLHGSGKTTPAGKLALRLKNEGRRVMLVAGDVYRPAAIDQLETIGRDIDVTVHAERTSVNVTAIVQNAVASAAGEGYDTVIVDTAGRLQIDDTMVQELVRIRQAVNPCEVLLVADAALGQEAVSVAEHFHKALGLTGFILTKLDGDARGGAVSLVEKAAAEIDEAEAKKLQERLKRNQFDYNDFLSQLRQLGRLGGMESLLKFLPGGRQIAQAAGQIDPKHFKHLEAIIQSMTKAERANPDLVDFKRRKRIAAGAGVPVEEVGSLVKQFETMRKMMRQNGMLGRLMAGGSLPEHPAPGTLGGIIGTPAPVSRKELERKRKAAKAARKERQKQRRRKR